MRRRVDNAWLNDRRQAWDNTVWLVVTRRLPRCDLKLKTKLNLVLFVVKLVAVALQWPSDVNAEETFAPSHAEATNLTKCK